MEIIEKKISDITPYENNPRNNDDAVAYVANSIREFGFKVPIVVDRDGVIVAGHSLARDPAWKMKRIEKRKHRTGNKKMGSRLGVAVCGFEYSKK